MVKEYCWEYEYPLFQYLQKILGKDKVRRKYSLIGNGIFTLVDIDNKIYEVKFSQAKKMLENDNKIIKDKNKDFIIKSIVDNFQQVKEYSVNDGKFITFKIDKFIIKLKIIKKVKEPN